MVGIWDSVSAVLLVLMMVSVGYLFGRAGWMKGEHKSVVIKFLINVAVPCMCIKNVFEYFTKDVFEQAGALLLVPILFNIVTFFLSVGLAKLIKVPRRRFGGFVVMCAFSNSLFIGFPIIHELFGDPGTPYMMLYYFINTAAFWSMGSFLIYKSGDAGEKLTVRQMLGKLVSPPLVALVAAIVLVLLDVQLPHLLLTFSGYMSATVSPLALLYVGFVMFETGLRNMKPDYTIWVGSAMRFVGVPALMLLMCHVAGITGLARSVYFIEAAMPVMTQSVVVSGLAGADEQYNALAMNLTTLLCLVAIPILMLIVA